MSGSKAQNSTTERSVGIAGRGPRIRNDIEGLRALAVLAVLVNHAFPKALPGGFAGVDIFFVISGYLIGRHLLQDIQAGRWSILRFYAKRARRIFPALALVLISVWCVGCIIFSATEFAALGKHVAAAAVFSNNFLLWSESGYFDAAAIDKPLLHLWSLGIEEQFYLLVPGILWLGTRDTTPSVRWVARLGALSLLATIVMSNFDRAASFYLLHTRFWELAAGVILAQAELRMLAHTGSQVTPHLASKRDAGEIQLFSIIIVFASVLVLGAGEARSHRDAILRDCGLALTIVAAATAAVIADRCARSEPGNQSRSWWAQHKRLLVLASSITGIALTGVSLATLSSSNWPGAQTLFPVVGSALLIAATPTAPINKLLAWKPLAFIGGISYPLYLWHWPAIVIWRLLRPEALSIELSIPLAASFLLAWLTKTFVEDPVRFGHIGAAVFRRPPLWPVPSALMFAASLGLWGLVSNGLPSRFPPRLRAMAEWTEIDPNPSWRVGHCYHYLNNTYEYTNECTPKKRPGVPLILLWGDSHAADLYPGIANVQSTAVFDLAQWTAAGCPPTVRPLIGESGACPKRRATAWNKLMQLNSDTIVLGGAWERYLEWGQSPDGILSTMTETIHSLKDHGIKRIVVFGPGPLWNTSLPIDLFRFMVSTRSKEIPERLGKVSEEVWRLDAAMAAQAVAENVQYVSILDDFCDKTGCVTLGDRTLARPDLLYGDRDHLTVSGSKILIAHSTRQLLGGD